MLSFLKSKKFHSLLGMFVSAAILIWIFAAMDWKLVLQEFQRISYYFIFPAIAITIIQFILRAIRWRYLLPEGEKLSISLLFDCLAIGNFASFVLPLRAGEFIRPYTLKIKSSYRFSTAFTSIVIERFFDLSMVLISFGSMIFFIPGIPSEVYKLAILLTIMAVGILVFMIAGSMFPDRVSSLARWYLRILPESTAAHIGKFVDDLLHGATVLRDLKRVAIIIFLSVLIWLSIYYYFQLVLPAFGMPNSFWMGVSVGVVTAITVAAPSAPGFLGPYEFGCIAGLALFGISKETAVAFSIVTHALQYVVVISLGLIALFRNSLHLSELEVRGEE